MFVAFCATLWALGGVVGAERDQASSLALTGEETRLIQLANAEREARKLGTLAIDPMLVTIARRHSREMADLNYFDHVSPTKGLRTPMDRYLAEYGKRPYWLYVGENLYYCSALVDPERAHRKLMESPSHRDNILDPKFTHIGVGTYVDKSGRFWVTQMLSARKDAPERADLTTAH
jgi:uncharacterized protein YkwD